MSHPQSSAPSIIRFLLGVNMGDVLDLKFRHVIWPTMFGIVLISACAASLEYHRFPPMILCLVIANLFSPVLCKLTRSGDIKEHAIGVALVCIPMLIFWSIGSSYWNIAIPFMVWFGNLLHGLSQISHRCIGVWHGFGIAFSIIPGAMLFENLF